MSGLRHRIFGSSPLVSNEGSPNDSEHRVVSVAKLNQLDEQTKKQVRTSKGRNGLIFGLGGIFGLALAAFFAQQHSVIDLDGLLDLNLDSLLDVIPAGIIKDARDLTV